MDYKAIKEKDVGMDRWHNGGRIDRVVEGRMDGWWDKRKDAWRDGKIKRDGWMDR